MISNKFPIISDAKKVCIICEGNEEYAYLDRLKNLDVWSSNYIFDLDNAGGNGNVPARYQDKFQNGSYDIVLVFCDTDKKPYEQYDDIKMKINTFHGLDNVADEIVIFGNPCTMQIIIEHWTDVKLKSNSKKRNAPLVQEFTGIENYDAHKDQIETLMMFITVDNYYEMCSRIKNFSIDDKVEGSTNILKFFECFSNEDDSWINNINLKLEAE